MSKVHLRPAHFCPVATLEPRDDVYTWYSLPKDNRPGEVACADSATWFEDNQAKNSRVLSTSSLPG